jgi:hypothetical protein
VIWKGRPVPRYFFHVHDSIEMIDQVGTECADLDEARAQAVKASGEMLRDLASEFWNGEHWRMWVTDESGATVCALRFSAEKT